MNCVEKAVKLVRTRVTSWLAVRLQLQWLREELILAPLEPILHASPKRLWWLGLSFFLGNAAFAWIWSSWLPQAYENTLLRIIASLLGYSLMLHRVNHNPGSFLTQIVFSFFVWFDLPVLFTWMYLCNGGSTVWLATLAAMVLIYYHVTDWRLATLGTITGSLLAWIMFMQVGPTAEPLPENQQAVHAVVFAFAWICALVLNLSSANLRRAHLLNTLTTIGIMAHELRTPLSTADLLGDAIQIEVHRQGNNPGAQQLEKLALRLHTLVRNMNRQIDTQIANAKLLQPPRYTELVSAAALINAVVDGYPFQSSRQRQCVQVLIHKDFVFRASSSHFSQVLDNLIKNALHSLMAADSKYVYGALRIEAGMRGDRGQIAVEDEGRGIDAASLAHVFKPFFSTNRSTGHGLGLAFCQQVVHSAGGSIKAKSKYTFGAVFTIELPVAISQP